MSTRVTPGYNDASNVFHEYGATGAPGLPAALGQTTSAASMPVVIANDQSTIPVNSELPAAAVAADSTGLPTAPAVVAQLQGYDGTTTRLLRTTTAGIAAVAPIVASDAIVDGSVSSLGRQVDQAGTGKITAVNATKFNGTGYDRERNNVDVTVLASAARTATPTKVDQTNYNGRSLVVVIDVTAAADTPSVVFTVQGKVGSVYYTLLASAAVTGTGTTVLQIGPYFAADVANSIKIAAVPRVFAVDAVHGEGSSITYSVVVAVLP